MSNPWHPWNVPSGHPEGLFRVIGLIVDAKDVEIRTGFKDYIVIPYDGTIIGWYLFADQSGDIVVDVWKDIWDNFPPTVADTIAGSEKPTLSAQVKNQDHALPSWTTDVKAGDVIGFNVDSVSTVTKITLELRVRPS